MSVLALLITDTSNQINSSTLNNSGSPEARTVVGLITQNKQGNATQDPQQRFISGVQLSALVQKVYLKLCQEVQNVVHLYHQMY